MENDRKIRVLWHYSTNGCDMYHCELEGANGVTAKAVEYSDLIVSINNENVFDVVLSADGRIVRVDGAEIPYRHYEKIPVKERLIVQRLRDFINNDSGYTIALVAGIRKTGKTTVLKQLQVSYPEAVYIDLSEAGVTQETIEKRFLSKTSKLLLLDEIAYLEDYEPLAQLLYDLSNKRGAGFKVIITGSSAAHVTKLSLSKLGGRARLFRLPPIMFVEYLYITGRISDYGDYDSVSNADFADYLMLKDLAELNMQFDKNYFQAVYNEVETGNLQRYMSYSLVDLEENDLCDMCNLIAYKLNDAGAYDKVMLPKVGGVERSSLANVGIKVDLGGVDLSDALLSISKTNAAHISLKAKCRILSFMLWNGLASVEFQKTDPDHELLRSGSILRQLENCSDEGQLRRLFKDVSICLTSPLFYTRIGSDILEHMDVDVVNLCAGPLLGKMLEVYVRGAVALHSTKRTLSTVKLNFEDSGEVDVFDDDSGLLCEVSISNKQSKEIHLRDYFRTVPLIRVCSTRDISYFNGIYHQIPYAKLCCMLDTGDVFKLERTIVAES